MSSSAILPKGLSVSISVSMLGRFPFHSELVLILSLSVLAESILSYSSSISSKRSLSLLISKSIGGASEHLSHMSIVLFSLFQCFNDLPGIWGRHRLLLRSSLLLLLSLLSSCLLNEGISAFATIFLDYPVVLVVHFKATSHHQVSEELSQVIIIWLLFKFQVSAVT